MSIRIFVPNDTAACSLGADAVAAAVSAEASRRGIDIELVRNGSRGAYWLEPLLEVESESGRIGFGPVSVADLPSLFDTGFADAAHSLALGVVDELPWFAGQQRVTFARAGLIDPLSLADYTAHGGFVGLRRALDMSAQQIVDAIRESGLRGRGGAAFPAGIKWQTVADQPVAQKFIVCNAEEGDSGTFADRLLIEADPFQLIEGMLIAAIAVGADKGYIGLRAEYPRAARQMTQALQLAHEAGYLGTNILGSGKSFEIDLHMGAGAYVCGEETALLESIEGRRGMVRAKPPLPAIQGLFGKPTLVHNVLTLAAATSVLAQGAAAYAALGSGRSRGTLAIQLGGNVKQGGLIEVPFGTSLDRVLQDFGAGTLSGRPLRTVQVGGPLGSYLPQSQWQTALDYEAFAAVEALLGHGGVVLFDDSVDMREQARFAMEFCAFESCGKCTPCRIGSTRGVEIIDRIAGNDNRDANLQLLDELCDTLRDGSLCALGSLTPLPVRSALRHFEADFRR